MIQILIFSFKIQFVLHILKTTGIINKFNLMNMLYKLNSIIKPSLKKFQVIYHLSNIQYVLKRMCIKLL